ncbi:hypothetical protein SUGI_0040130 [Cryptomeria japonica]|nr:hypothetical protein SUGI_0040130 [Cryptomeria japonica]
MPDDFSRDVPVISKWRGQRGRNSSETSSPFPHSSSHLHWREIRTYFAQPLHQHPLVVERLIMDKYSTGDKYALTPNTHSLI